MRLDQKLSAIRSGKASPANAAEAAVLAELALTRKRQPRIATKLFQAALGDAALSPRLRFQHQYDAACAALLCAAGKVEKESKPPDAAEAARLLKQALDWLTGNLATWRQLMKSNPKARVAGVKQLRHWLSDPDLESVRGKAIDQLPQSEREGWRKLWADVAEVLDAEPVVAPRPRSLRR